MSKTFTTAEVGKHKDEGNGYWIIVENDVYDLTSKCLPCAILPLPAESRAAAVAPAPSATVRDGHS